MLAFLVTLAVERQESGELDHAARRAEEIPAQVEVDRRRVEDRRRHLRGHEALPDQLVELELVSGQIALDQLRTTSRVGGANPLVRILRVLDLAIAIELRPTLREIALAEQATQVIARLNRRALRDACRVCPHIRDQTDGALFFPQLNALVEILRQAHRALGAERELLGAFLLERAGRERRLRIFPALAALDVGDEKRADTRGRGRSVRGLAHPSSGVRRFVDDATGIGFVGDLRFLAIDLMELRAEPLALVLQRRRDGPVLDGLERADLAFALDQQPQGDGLNAT